MRVETEVLTSMGRLDLVTVVDGIIYIFEFKFDEPALSALDQIKTLRYAERYMHSGKKIILVGASVDRAQRQIIDWTEFSGS